MFKAYSLLKLFLYFTVGILISLIAAVIKNAFSHLWLLYLWLFSFLVCLVVGILYSYNILLLLKAYIDRRAFIKFATTVHAAIIQADIGKGKTILLSILAKELPFGIKKAGFINNINGVDLLSYSDLNFKEKISFRDSLNLPKYFFLDETNFMIDGVSFMYNRVHHEGVAQLQQIARHLSTRIWVTATRGNHVWIALREIVNYYVKLGGVKKLFNFGGTELYTLKIYFYNQGWELEKSFNILITNLDFELYDSFWLADANKFRIKYENAEQVNRSVVEKGPITPNENEIEEVENDVSIEPKKPARRRRKKNLKERKK